jgi:hypothetical protein
VLILWVKYRPLTILISLWKLLGLLDFIAIPVIFTMSNFKKTKKMKKFLALVVLLVGFTYGSSAFAGIDLQPRNVWVVDNNLTGNGPLNGLYLSIQNNGLDDFTGSFVIKVYTNNHGDLSYNFSGVIASGNYSTIMLPYLGRDFYAVQVDAHNDVTETNEGNNYLYYQDGKAQVGIASSWNNILAQDYRDTLFVLPNELFYSEFSLEELNNQKSIIGFNASCYTSGFSGVENFSFCLQSKYQVDESSYNANYTVKNSSADPYDASCEWLANSSSSAIDYFWLGNFSGYTKGKPIGSEWSVWITVNSATNDLQQQNNSVFKTIKSIDRIRGDVNGDGVVDQKDLDILYEVISRGLYNPCDESAYLYRKIGINYGAGAVLFSTPDILSNTLINIWINDHNDPLVQGLGIGELMSTTADKNEGSPIYGVKNNFSISGEDLSIDAPEADLYNVTAQKADGKLFQVTGKMGEQIKVPVGAKNIRVETVKVKHDITVLTTPKNNINVSVYPTKISDYMNVKYSGNGKVQVVNLAGQIIFSSLLKSDEELRIEAGSWSNGVYIINVTSETGTNSTKVIK